MDLHRARTRRGRALVGVDVLHEHGVDVGDEPVSCSGVRRRLMVSLVAMSSHSAPKTARPRRGTRGSSASRDRNHSSSTSWTARRSALPGGSERASGIAIEPGRALPPAFAALAAGRVLAHEARALELAQVVARGPARLAEPVGQPARGQRAVRRELVVDAHPQRVRERLQARRVVITWSTPGWRKLLGWASMSSEFVFVMMQRYRCKETVASISLQQSVCNFEAGASTASSGGCARRRGGSASTRRATRRGA